MTIKVGDTVRRVRHEWNGMRVGDTGKVLKIDGTDCYIEGYLHEGSLKKRAHASSVFEVVVEPKYVDITFCEYSIQDIIKRNHSYS